MARPSTYQTELRARDVWMVIEPGGLRHGVSGDQVGGGPAGDQHAESRCVGGSTSTPATAARCAQPGSGGGVRPGKTTEEIAEIKRLRKEHEPPWSVGGPNVTEGASTLDVWREILVRALNVKHVQITCDGLYGRIVVDDQVLTLLLAGYELAHTAGKVPQVGLHAGPAASLSSLSAWPVPLSPNRGDPGPAVAVFLRATTPPN